MRVSDALAEGVARLRAAQIEGAPRDAGRLLSHALGLAPDRLLLAIDDQMTEAQVTGFRAAIASRAARQPVAQIIGHRLFWGRSFSVTSDVLDPRPETETLIEAALAQPFENVLDLGTGSGVILLTLLAERAQARGMGVDISPAALEVGRANARALALEARAEFAQSDWFGAVSGRYDLIVANPPYIGAEEFADLAPDVRDWEPRGALVPADCDGSGLAAYRLICAQAPKHLQTGGWLMVEIGHKQGQSIAALFDHAGLQKIDVLQDLSGHDRVVIGQTRIG
ncbi:MAG: peptide chain release factor N(5)-glutamine methyltransferase [Rhodobacteraceae bacterium]|nr:MAG: peptide chain release factor N(5)-glutamine methyltransferase [Paracoccaceae bacterium]